MMLAICLDEQTDDERHQKASVYYSDSKYIRQNTENIPTGIE